MTVMAADETANAKLTSGVVAAMTGLSQDTVLRIPKDVLDYWVTPGGHRRYRLADVERYAREVLGREAAQRPPEGE